MLGNLINSFIPRAATVQTLGHPSAGVVGWLNPEGDNVSGEVVTEDISLKIAAMWCGIRIISETLASLPCILYRRNGDNKERATNDPRYSLVHDSPNEEIDAYHFFEASTAHVVLWGNSYAKVIRDGSNRPKELEIRLPDRTEPKRRRSDGVLVYECDDPKEQIEFQDCLHTSGFGFDGIMGYRLIKYAGQSLGIAMAADKHAGSSLKNGNVPSGVLDHPTKLEKSVRDLYRKEWEEVHGGGSNAGKIAITHGGIKYTPFGMTHEDAQLLESRKFSIPEIARWLRLPPHMLADLENSQSKSNIEQQAMEFIQYSLTPWCKRWEGALKMRLLRREERGSMFFEFLFDSLLRGDTLTRYQAHAIARNWGWRNVNEIKKIENENTIGPDGDIYLQPLNMQPAGEPTEEIPPTIKAEYQKALTSTIRETFDTARQMRQDLELGLRNVHEAFTDFGQQIHSSLSSERETFVAIKQDIEKLGKTVVVAVPEVPIDNRIPNAVRELLHHAISSLLKIEASEAIKAAAGQSRGQNFIKRIDEFYEKHLFKVAERLVPIQKVVGHMPGDFVTGHVEFSKRELLECSDGDPAEFEARVKACVEKWQTERLEKEIEELHAKLFGNNVSG